MKLNWDNYHLFQKEEEIRGELGKLEIKKVFLLNKIEETKKEINSLAFKYKRSYYKTFYLNFSSISELCDYRINLQLKHYNYKCTLDSYFNELRKCNKLYVLLTNNLVMYSILLQKN